ALVAGLGGGNALGGAFGAGLTSKLGGVLNDLSDEIRNRRPTGNADIDQALGQIVATGVGTAVGAVVGGSSGAFTGFNADRFNRQLHSDERQWAKDKTTEFAAFYEKITGRTLSAEQAESMLLANGYRLVDSVASKGPGGDAVAVAYISRYGGKLFQATAAEYNDPFLYGNSDHSLSPEQHALTFPVGRPGIGPFTVQIGGNAGIHVFNLGGTGEMGLSVSFGKHPNLCTYAQACATMGLGFTVGAGVSISAGQGSASTGVTSSTGGFVAGGAGLFGNTSVSRDSNGNLAAGKGVLGVGMGAATGAQQCKQVTGCLAKEEK
ncbi:MAG: hypothetical protein P4L87_18900, partial [Formivibrio sp.]|nr:hypothetical protein [Formivibrio sp.]